MRQYPGQNRRDLALGEVGHEFAQQGGSSLADRRHPSQVEHEKYRLSPSKIQLAADVVHVGKIQGAREFENTDLVRMGIEDFLLVRLAHASRRHARGAVIRDDAGVNVAALVEQMQAEDFR